MKTLDLNRLTGPEGSIDENFEVLCLELVKVHASAHRRKPPDEGIDIYVPSRQDAFQCKAYPQFRPDLVKSLKKSAIAAKTGKTPFRGYTLMIPFVPTASQRDKLMEALKFSDAERPYICDGDEIETRLYEEPTIANRFFPTVTFMMPPDVKEVVLKTDEQTECIRIQLQSIKSGQNIPITVTRNALVGGLLNFLNYLLHLPSTFKVVSNGFNIYGGKIKWILALMKKTELIHLAPNAQLSEAGVRNGDTVRLVYDNDVKVTGGFSKHIGTTLEYNGILDSHIWSEKEMNENLVDIIWNENEYREENGLANQLDEFIEWHIKNFNLQ